MDIGFTHCLSPHCLSVSEKVCEFAESSSISAIIFKCLIGTVMSEWDHDGKRPWPLKPVSYLCAARTGNATAPIIYETDLQTVHSIYQVFHFIFIGHVSGPNFTCTHCKRVFGPYLYTLWAHISNKTR